MILASNVTGYGTHKEDLSGIIYVPFINEDGEVWLMKIAPDGTKLPFTDNSTEKRISSITALSVSIVSKSGILCLKYTDDNGDLQQLFSSDNGDTWGSSY